jgi:hypothetical protein
MRYTEVRLAKIADSILADLERILLILSLTMMIQQRGLQFAIFSQPAG